MMRSDHWDRGDVYELFMGRWSRLTAVHFVQWLAAAPDLFWLDLGCGTGALTAALQQYAQPKQIVGVEPSLAFIETARARYGRPTTTFQVGDASHIPLANGQVDVLVSGLALNFFPDMTGAMAEMQRVVKPGGTIAVYVWDYAGDMQFLRMFWDTAVALNPAASELDEAHRFPICRPEPLRRLFGEAGWQQVAVSPLDISTRFADFDDYWRPFLGGVGPAPAYLASLTEAQRQQFQSHLRQLLPVATDGSISLMARAWAVRGTAVRHS